MHSFQITRKNPVKLRTRSNSKHAVIHCAEEQAFVIQNELLNFQL